jgi:tetraacyldisaccharide 4'-kinase
VVSIGNITVGGTGKTPMVYHVATLLKNLGLAVAVISRGYGGHAERLGGIVSDGSQIIMGLEASGDEPQLLAQKLEGVPVLIGKDKHRAGRLAIESFGASVLVLDDGFQHLALKRDLNLLLLDSARPFGNGYLVPRGTLREPVDQIERATAFVFTRWRGTNPFTFEDTVYKARFQGRPIFKCMHLPERLYAAGQTTPFDLAYLKGRRVLAFSGIARNEYFRETLVALEGSLAGFLEFGDHHRYSPRDLGGIWKRAKALKVDNLITTEKDYVNMLSEIPATPELLVLGIGISFGKERESFESYIAGWALSS